VCIQPEAGTESIIVKLKKEYFGLVNDIFVCFAYCVPSSSQVLHRAHMPDDLFEDLNAKLARYSALGDLILMGDLNSRTYGLHDCIQQDNSHLPLPQMYPADTVGTFERHSLDRNVNVYGRKFIELCRSVPLRILNGRKLGDLMGNYTCINSRGSSVVDYGAVSPSLFSAVPAFQVHHLLPQVSDHTALTLWLSVNARIEPPAEDYNFINKPDKVVWNKQLEDAFKYSMQSPDCQGALSGFLATGILPNQSSVDHAAQFLCNVLKHSANVAGMQLKKGTVPRRCARPDQRPRVRPPRWHGAACQQAKQSITLTSKLLSQYPNNAFLRGRLFTETKYYKKLVKQTQKSFLSNMFDELDSVQQSDPRRYMDLVRALRQGSHDKATPSDTASVPPGEWLQHFTELLGSVRQLTAEEQRMRDFVSANADRLASDLDRPIQRAELLNCIKKLKNNKATGFDGICNEMLKCCAETLCRPLLLLFNTMLTHNIYVTAFKQDILGPLHKAGAKTDCNNFRGICVSSNVGKLFKSILRYRLEEKCRQEAFIPLEQCSGKSNTRTADHLMVFKHIITKYVKNENRTLYACFFDLAKAYDKTNRTQLFYRLLTEYSIGGKYLKILQNIYTDNMMHVKLDQGLTQPFKTTVGVFQGCNLSNILFNLYTGKLPGVYDAECDPVYIQDRPVHALCWADDAVVLSLSQAGLQRSIDRTVAHYSSLGLSINVKKTKVLVFNKRGLGPNYFKKLHFSANGQRLELAERYTYLGSVFIPSGAVYAAADQLVAKCSRAWFATSNVIFQHKKMPVDRALKLVDSIVLPVGLYASEFLAPLSLSKPCLSSKESLLRAWESYRLETVNQRVCRMILSVHKKTSRLAVLGELGRYPVLLKSLHSSLMYEWSIRKHQAGTLLGLAVAEMAASTQDSWLSRVRTIQSLLLLM
jgi:hypothetical protein